MIYHQSDIKKYQMSFTHFTSTTLVLLLSILFYYVWNHKQDFVENHNLRQKLQTCLQDKIEFTENNINLAQMCQDSEKNYVNLLLKMQELHQALHQKSEKIKSLLQSNQDLKEEIAILKRLFVNG